MRLWRIRLSSFRCLCFRIFLRRFLTTLPMGGSRCSGCSKGARFSPSGRGSQPHRQRQGAPCPLVAQQGSPLGGPNIRLPWTEALSAKTVVDRRFPVSAAAASRGVLHGLAGETRGEVSNPSPGRGHAPTSTPPCVRVTGPPLGPRERIRAFLHPLRQACPREEQTRRVFQSDRKTALSEKLSIR